MKLFFGRAENFLEDAAAVPGWRNQARPPAVFVGRDLEKFRELFATLTEDEREQGEWAFPYGALKPSEILSVADRFQGPRGRDLFDERVAIDLNPRCEVVQQCRGSSFELSVILPCFERAPSLREVLPRWLSQNAEVIVVDDGSSSPWILELVGQFPDRLTLLRLSERPTGNGDHRFRAGLARNAGLSHAHGSQIVFADCDILVPQDFAQSMTEALRWADLVMPQRWQLNPELKERPALLRPEYHAVLTPGAHWENFQTSTQNWQSEPYRWKWVSSFCLGLRRPLLEAIGGMRPSFVTYGFEDAELGYRAAGYGARFQLLQLNCFHLPQADCDSQFGNDLNRRTQLFRISADRFFRHHPDREVFTALRQWLE